MDGDDDLRRESGAVVKHLPPGDVAWVQILKIKLVHNNTRVYYEPI